MGWRRAALAAGAGALTFLMIALALDAVLLSNLQLQFGARVLTAPERTFWAILPPAAVVLGGALTLRALGVPRWRAALVPLPAHLVAFAAFRLAWRGDFSLYQAAALGLIVGAALTLALGAAWPPGQGRRVARTLFAVTLPPLALAAIPAREVVFAGLLAWVFLPVVAVAMRSRGDRAPVSDKAT